MVIVVSSCDKNQDIFYAFYHCMEKYWKDHTEIIYITETVQNPYYKTINKDYPIELWTRRIREALQEIEDKLNKVDLDSSRNLLELGLSGFYSPRRKPKILKN